MSSRRPPADRTDAAARRLAELAVGLGAVPDVAPDGAAHPDAPDEWWADHTRVAAPLVLDAAPATATPEVPLLPVPGRHAARRRLVLPDLRGRLPVLAPVHVALVALAVAIGLAVTTWWVVRDDPGPVVEPVSAEPLAPVVEPSAEPSSSGTGSPSSGGSAAPTGSRTVTVDVTGKVRRPGIVVLEQGARVTDALSAAGGARRGVDLSTLNLARVLVDGEQIVVGARSAGAAPVAPPAAAGGASSGAPAAPVNLNLAGQAELETLPGVGPVTAQAILAWRDQQGGFTSVDELLEVDGIGEKTLARLAPYVTV